MGDVRQAAQEISAPPRLRVLGASKSYGGVQALRGVDFEVRGGEVHALLGENGAGKSTLIKLLSGVHAPDGGRLELDGEPVAFASPAQSRDAGVAVVYQELSLVESLSVADNLMLGRETLAPFGFLKTREATRRAQAFLADLGVPLDARTSVGSLPFAYRQMTEIAKALMGDARLLILDEPTSSLTSDETRILFEAIRGATRRGVGVVYVTHRLVEVFELSDRVTVLRDGANAGVFTTSQTDMRSLVRAIVGAELKRAPDGARKRPRDAATLLSLSNVRDERLDGVDLSVRAGEIHGVAGLIGSGRTEILEVVFGLRQPQSGELTLYGERWTPSGPGEAIDKGVALAPEDRHAQGLVLDHSIERNISLPRLPWLARWGWMQFQQARAKAMRAVTALAIRAEGPSTMVRTLSGGNQQKVVFAKWREPRPRLLLLDEPTVGVDVGAREEIYEEIRQVVAEGAGALVVSSDLAELVELCDRISVLVDGRIVRGLERGEVENAEALHHLLQSLQTPEPAAKEAMA